MEKLHHYEDHEVPEVSKQIFKEIEKVFGGVPNIFRVVGATPSVLEAVVKVDEYFSKTSLSPVEQQVVLLTTSYEDSCRYCASVHTMMMNMLEVDADTIDRVRSGRELSDKKLEALRQFVVHAMKTKGHVTDEMRENFLKAGFKETQMLEVALGISLKTLTNYINNMANTKLDEMLKPFEWKK